MANTISQDKMVANGNSNNEFSKEQKKREFINWLEVHYQRKIYLKTHSTLGIYYEWKNGFLR